MKNLWLFPTSPENASTHLLLANFFTASQRLAVTTHRLVSYCWPKT